MLKELHVLVGMLIFGFSPHAADAQTVVTTHEDRNIDALTRSHIVTVANETLIPDTRVRYNRATIDSDSPYFGAQGIGKVTSSTVDVNSTKLSISVVREAFIQEENSKFGTGFLVSPCHMITNYHVICDHDGEKICKEHEEVLHKSVNFSFFENKHGTDYRERVTGKVSFADQEADYAIVQIDSLKKKSNVPFLTPDFNKVSNIDDVTSWTGGYNVRSLGEKNSHLYGMKAKLKRIGPYIYASQGNIIITNGNSGGPTMHLDRTGLTASGILSDSAMEDKDGLVSVAKGVPTITSLTAIGNDLHANAPELYQYMLNAIHARRCE